MKVAKRKRAAVARMSGAKDAAAPSSAVTADVVIAGAEIAPPPSVELSVAAPSMPHIAVVNTVVSVTADAPVVTLASNCTVKDATVLKHALCAVVDSDAAVTLDVSGVERIDTATMQVLCAFVVERVEGARKVVWKGVPDVLQEAARLLGIHDLLVLPAAAAGVVP